MAGAEREQGFPGTDVVTANPTADRYVPSGSIDERQAEELALVGFSPHLPATMAELNEAITALDTFDAFKGYRFTMTPDYNKPKIEVDAHYVPNMTVVLDACTAKRADLSIRPRSHGGFLCQATLPDLKDFLENGNFELSGTTMSATPHAEPDAPRPQTRTKSLNEIANESDLRDLGIEPTRAELTLTSTVKESPTQLSLEMGWLDPRFTRTDEMLFRVRQLEASGHSHEIEMLIGSVAVLLGKHAL